MSTSSPYVVTTITERSRITTARFHSLADAKQSAFAQAKQFDLASVPFHITVTDDSGPVLEMFTRDGCLDPERFYKD